MAQIIQLKRSSTANKVPLLSDLVAGELAINTNDGRVFFERDDASIQHIVTTNSQTTGSINLTGAVTASFFNGNGSALTNLNGANLQAGTVTGTQLNTSVAGTGLSGGGGSALSVDYGSSAGTAVQGNTSLTIQGTANQISVSGGSITLGSGGTATLSLPSTLILTTVSASVFSGSFVGNGSGLTNIIAPGTVSASAQIDHDQTTNFVSNEHINHSSVTLTAGNGLTGGGDITTSRTFNVGAGSGISVAADSVAVDSTVLRTTGAVGVISSSVQVNHDATTNFVANEHIDHSTVSITAGSGMSGGGNITTTRTLTLNTGSAHFTDGVKSKLNTEGVISSSAQINGNGIFNLTSGEVTQLANINSTTISATQWGYLGVLDQNLRTTDTVTFHTASFTGNVTINGNLSVLGDATEIQVGELRIEDKLITVASGSTTSAAADGAGIEVAGANTSITWDHNTTRWVVDQAFSSSVGFYGDGSGLINVTAAGVTFNDITNRPSGLSESTTGIVSSSVQVNHDATTNFVADEHIAHSTVTLTAGAGLTGGGTIAASRTFTVGAGSGITVNADDVALNTGSAHFISGVQAVTIDGGSF